jgi:exopolyphosphatase/guanosine-5'-triphosphate,3'-diphosphate pyrophosphatase
LSDAQQNAIDGVLATSDWAIGHVRHVRLIATWLYEALRELHGLGDDDAILLQAAALLHDVGFPSDPSRHHKVSARIIRALLGPPFTADQVEIIALLARYHREAPPKLTHRRYSRLDAHGRRQVNWLAGILRVADGLDRGHDSRVQWLMASIVHERLEIQVCDHPPKVRPHALADDRNGSMRPASDPLADDVAGAMRKRDLLERALGMPAVIHSLPGST